MLAQPTDDTPTDTAALERELVELRQTLAKVKRIINVGLLLCIIGGVIFFGVMNTLFGEDTASQWGYILMFTASLPLVVLNWHKEHTEHRIAHVQLLLYGTAQRQTDFKFIQTHNTLLILNRAWLILTPCLLALWTFYPQYSDFTETAVLLVVMGIHIYIPRLEKRLKPIQQQLDEAEKAATSPGGGQHARSAE